MMDRIPEPELMNDEAQAKAYACADFSSAHSLFVEKFKEKFPGFMFDDIVLDLGCGPCDITRRFARAFPDTGFHAVDGAAEMLKHAKVLNERADLGQRIKLIEGCIPDVKLPQSFYHAIISNSLLHHCHDPIALWDAIQTHSKPYTHVFVMDLQRPVDAATVNFLVDEYAANEPEILRKDFKNSLHAAFTIKEVRGQLDEKGLSQLQVEEASDRHMIIYGNM
jgi:2-polyprenyl-3-methyl-5-hydroxy-6-metoxy-1,4-benzoquinol methylase